MTVDDITEGKAVTVVCFKHLRMEQTRLPAVIASVSRDSTGRITELAARATESGVLYSFIVDDSYLRRRDAFRDDGSRRGASFPPDEFGTGAYLIGMWPPRTTPKGFRKWVRVVAGDDPAGYEELRVKEAPIQSRISSGVALFEQLFGRRPQLQQMGPSRGDVLGTVDAIAMRLLETPARQLVAGEWVKWRDIVDWTSKAGKETRAEAFRLLEQEFRVEQREVKTMGRPGLEVRLLGRIRTKNAEEAEPS